MVSCAFRFTPPLAETRLGQKNGKRGKCAIWQHPGKPKSDDADETAHSSIFGPRFRTFPSAHLPGLPGLPPQKQFALLGRTSLFALCKQFRPLSQNDGLLDKLYRNKFRAVSARSEAQNAQKGQEFAPDFD